MGSGRIAIPPLIDALGDEDPRVRTAAAVALGPIGNDRPTSGFDREAVRDAMVALLRSLRDPEPSVRAAAANVLMSMTVARDLSIIDRQAVLAVLVEQLGNRDSRIRRAAIQIVGALGPWAQMGPPTELVAALREESVDMRAMAIFALGRFDRGLEPLIPSLLQVVESDEPSVSAAGAALLEALSPPTNLTKSNVPQLIEALHGPDRRVRAVTCSMLGKLGPDARAAIPSLIATAREPLSDSARSEHPNRFPDLRAIEALGRSRPDPRQPARPSRP